MSTATAQVQPTTTTASEFMSILIDDNKRSNAVSVGTDGVKLMDNGVSTVTGAVSSSIEERIYEVLRSQGVYRTLDGLFVCENNYVDAEIRWKISRFIDGIIEQYIRTSLDNTPLNSGDGCDACNRSEHPINSSDSDYRKMLSLVPERGVFKLYTDWRLLVLYATLIGTLIPTLYAIYKLRQDGIDPGGLTGTIVLIAIASVGFVRELFYPETELRDFLRAKVAVSKFSKYCKQKGVCGSCVAALAVKNRADFGPVAVGPYASIAGGKPGPPERGKVFMDEPCDIKCFYAAGFALTPSAQFVSNNISLPLMDGDTKIVEMELPPVFKQLIAYRGNNHFDTISAADYFIVGMSDKYDHNVPTLTLGVATIRNDQIIRVEWLPVPTNAFVGYSSFNLSTLKHYVQ
ncbi:hypothetical protein GQ42DRAFT_180474 [Ramicandelaber brevisporus]|nr:hypothetical protein GQ42DRAFT_180474 [Ramicandelaber brevisporus]